MFDQIIGEEDGHDHSNGESCEPCQSIARERMRIEQESGHRGGQRDDAESQERGTGPHGSRQQRSNEKPSSRCLSQNSCLYAKRGSLVSITRPIATPATTVAPASASAEAAD